MLPTLSRWHAEVLSAELAKDGAVHRSERSWLQRRERLREAAWVDASANAEERSVRAHPARPEARRIHAALHHHEQTAIAPSVSAVLRRAPLVERVSRLCSHRLQAMLDPVATAALEALDERRP